MPRPSPSELELAAKGFISLLENGGSSASSAQLASRISLAAVGAVSLWAMPATPPPLRYLRPTDVEGAHGAAAIGARANRGVEGGGKDREEMRCRRPGDVSNIGNDDASAGCGGIGAGTRCGGSGGEAAAAGGRDGGVRRRWRACYRIWQKYRTFRGPAAAAALAPSLPLHLRDCDRLYQRC
jgi:hypothetical protein